MTHLHNTLCNMQLGLEEGIRLENNGSVKILMIPHEY